YPAVKRFCEAGIAVHNDCQPGGLVCYGAMAAALCLPHPGKYRGVPPGRRPGAAGSCHYGQHPVSAGCVDEPGKVYQNGIKITSYDTVKTYFKALPGRIW